MMRNIPSLSEQFPDNLLEINPETATKIGIEDSDIVSVESPRGRIECSAKVTDCIDPRVVGLYHGFAKSNCNVLILMSRFVHDSAVASQQALLSGSERV